jgi:hypothetical protein
LAYRRVYLKDAVEARRLLIETYEETGSFSVGDQPTGGEVLGEGAVELAIRSQHSVNRCVVYDRIVAERRAGHN